MPKRTTKPRKKQRIVLGVGYPWFLKHEGGNFPGDYLADGYGEPVGRGHIRVNARFKLVLEAV